MYKLVDFNKWFAMKHWWPYEEGNKYKVSPIARFTLADFVIAQPSFEYFTYLGSLTTPPCTEDTRFIIPNICSCITKKTVRKYCIEHYFVLIIGCNQFR